MKQPYELDTPSDSYQAIVSGAKTFLVQRHSQNYEVGDFLLLREFSKGNLTCEESMHQVTYITDYLEPEGFIIMAIRKVPSSFSNYLSMTAKEQEIFKAVLSHLYLHSQPNRATSNTLWGILYELLDHENLSDADRNWYREYWAESDNKL